MGEDSSSPFDSAINEWFNQLQPHTRLDTLDSSRRAETHPDSPPRS